MEFYQLEQFLAIAETENMRLAAEQMNLTQPALSNSLKRLETELGCQLFDRQRNRLALNGYGRLLLKHTDSILKEIQDARKEIDDLRRQNSSKIVVGGYSLAFLYFVLPCVAKEFQDFQFLCEVKSAEKLTGLLQQDMYDLILMPEDDFPEEIETVSVAEEQLMLLAPLDSDIAACREISPEELKTQSILVVSDAAGYTEWYKTILQSFSHPYIGEISLEDYLNQKNDSHTSCLTSTFFMQFVPEPRNKTAIPVRGEGTVRKLCLAYRKSNYQKVFPVVEYVKENQKKLFDNISFMQYFMFPNESTNLKFQ